MKKLITVAFGALAALLAYQFLDKFEIQGLTDVTVAPRGADGSADGSTSLPTAQPDSTIRVATFNIQVFGTSKSEKPIVMDKLCQIVRNFDVVAIQEIRATSQDILPNFVEQINQPGRQYDYIIGPRLGRTTSKEQYAFVFDRNTVEIDRNQAYTVADPDDLLHREPFVVWFRARGPAPEDAYTFTLVNIHTDPDETDQELNALDDVYRVVLNDGRQEDDVIVLGDLNVDDQHLGQLGEISGMTWVISGVPTNTRGTSQYDNIVFHSRATSEFTGRAGVFDYMRLFNLTMEEALEISDHMPVWAEFSVYEGGQPGRIASRP